MRRPVVVLIRQLFTVPTFYRTLAERVTVLVIRNLLVNNLQDNCGMNKADRKMADGCWLTLSEPGIMYTYCIFLNCKVAEYRTLCTRVRRNNEQEFVGAGYQKIMKGSL